MNILVTGIDGFVGSHLAEALVRQGESHLFGTIPRSGDFQNLVHLKESITPVRADILSFDEIRQAIEKISPEKVFHLAGQAFVPLSLEDPRGTFRTNVDGTLNVLEAIRQYTTSRRRECSVLVVGSGEEYGAVSPEFQPIDEDVPLRPSNPYATSKACIDLIARQYRASYGLDVIVARPFNHLGPRQSERFVGSAFAKQIVEVKLRKREPKLLVGNLSPERDFTDVRDVVRAYLMLLDHPLEHDVFNICSGKGVAVHDLLQHLIALAGVDIDIVSDPSRKRANEPQSIVGSAERLRRTTGWIPTTPLHETLKDLLVYWEERIGHDSV
ncbi:MAG: GDP-mannose 4,6-dehydratase [Ignavibacteriae bacterium]|nr:GDP-mannose 4,6-dehydratase [Ignavibacteria bacterium]MBI3363540.1 GDP-mannose 4,6-dehydratase [Ignavibacteriota bacterium]